MVTKDQANFFQSQCHQNSWHTHRCCTTAHLNHELSAKMDFHHAHNEKWLGVVDGCIRRRHSVWLRRTEVQSAVNHHRWIQHDGSNSMLIVTNSTHVLLTYRKTHQASVSILRGVMASAKPLAIAHTEACSISDGSLITPHNAKVVDWVVHD